MNRLKKILDKQHFHFPYVWAVIGLRVIVPFYIFVNPLWGFTASSFIDYWDAYFFMHKAKMSWKEYQLLDKYLDWLSYICMFAVGVRRGFFYPLLWWLVLRLIGQVIFVRTKRSICFLVFPNIFEMMFLWYVVMVDQLKFTGGGLPFWFWFLLFIGIKEIQEVWIHFFWPNHLKKHGYPKFLRRFGYDAATLWC